MDPDLGGAALDHPTVPRWLQGLWRRRSITYPDGRIDDTTAVYWLQAESVFIDIRIPADRPDLRRAAGCAALSEAQLASLARQGGFAGWTELHGDRCRWHREIDFQPPARLPDEGRLRWQGGLLIEEGVHEPYREVWEPVDRGGRTDAARLTLPDAAPDGRPRELLVVSGDVFLFARGRRVSLPRGASLEALVLDAASRPAEIERLLDCEISYGRRAGGRVPWEVELSTIPFREGRSLAIAWRDRAS